MEKKEKKRKVKMGREKVIMEKKDKNDEIKKAEERKQREKY